MARQGTQVFHRGEWKGSSRKLEVRAQEVDLVGEYTLTHGVTVEVKVGDRVATQLPARRPLGYLPRELLRRLEVAFGYNTPIPVSRADAPHRRAGSASC